MINSAAELQYFLFSVILKLCLLYQNYERGIIMRKKAETAAAVSKESTKPKTGRKTMSPEEKEAAAKARALEKEKARNMRPEIFVQYQGGEVGMDALTEAVKASFHGEKKRTLITSLKMYVKPEEHTVYYVVNETIEGKLPF